MQRASISVGAEVSPPHMPPHVHVWGHLQDVEEQDRASMLVLSEFVGCSPSVSGAIRVNPWSVDNVADGIYSAINTPLKDQHQRHAKHWRYVSQHTVKYWAQVRACVCGCVGRAHLRASRV